MLNKLLQVCLINFQSLEGFEISSLQGGGGGGGGGGVGGGGGGGGGGGIISLFLRAISVRFGGRKVVGIRKSPM